jgi:hypothetical protein
VHHSNHHDLLDRLGHNVSALSLKQLATLKHQRHVNVVVEPLSSKHQRHHRLVVVVEPLSLQPKR